MGERGKKSGASLAVMKSKITAITRPVPPKSLTDEQASIWREIVERLPSEWFPREMGWGV